MNMHQAAQTITDRADVSTTLTGGDVAAWEDGIRDDFDKDCLPGNDLASCGTVLLSGVNRLYDILNTQPQYLDTLAAASQYVPEERQPWGWHLLINTPFLQVGLITLYQFFSIPLHDHPNTWVAQRVISGKVRIRQYQHAPDANPSGSLISLKQVSDCELVKSENSTFTPSLRNLHEMEGTSPQCVILSMAINPYLPQDRSWYYPVIFTQSGNTGLYNRIRRKTVKTKTTAGRET